MRIYRSTFVFIIALILSLFAVGVVFGERGYGGGKPVLINKFGTCARVTNRNSLDLLIPTGAAGEWSNFRSYAPNVGIGGISAASFTLGYASYGPSGAVTIQCGDSGTIGLRYQPNTFNTCSYAFYTGPTFDSSPSYARSDGGCYPLPQPPDGRVPDFVYGIPAAYSWQIHSGNGCNGCAYQNVSYNGADTITFYSGQLTPYGNVTVTWDSAGSTIVNIPPEPPPPCDPNDPNGGCYECTLNCGGDSGGD